MFGDLMTIHWFTIYHFVRSLPADFFDQGVSKRLGEDGDDSDSGEGGRSGDTVKTNSKPLSKSNAGESSQPNSKK